MISMVRMFINNKLYDELGCDPKVRRHCDSGYIKIYKELMKKYNELLSSYDKLKEENEQLKQLLEIYQVVSKGGEHNVR